MLFWSPGGGGFKKLMDDFFYEVCQLHGLRFALLSMQVSMRKPWYMYTMSIQMHVNTSCLLNTVFTGLTLHPNKKALHYACSCGLTRAVGAVEKGPCLL